MESETSQYDEKFKEMQQYIPFLNEIMNKIENVANETNQSVRGIQLSKIKSLKSLLCMTENRMKMENLLRCEEILKKLKNKMEKSSKSSPVIEEKVTIAGEEDAKSNIVEIERCKDTPKSLNFYKEYQSEEDSDNKSKYESTNDTIVPTSDLEICRMKLRELTKDSLIDDSNMNVIDSPKNIKPLEKEIKIVTEAYIKGEIKVIPDFVNKTSKPENSSESKNEDIPNYKSFKPKNAFFNVDEKYSKNYQSKQIVDLTERNTSNFFHRKDISYKMDKAYIKHGNNHNNDICYRRSTSRSNSSQSCNSQRHRVLSHKSNKKNITISSKKLKKKHKKNMRELLQRSESQSSHSSKSSCSISELHKSNNMAELDEISDTSNSLSTNSEIPISDAVSLTNLLRYRNQLKKELKKVPSVLHSSEINKKLPIAQKNENEIVLKEDGEIVESEEDQECSTKIESNIKLDIKSNTINNKESSNTAENNIRHKSEDSTKQSVSINDLTNVDSPNMNINNKHDLRDNINFLKNKTSEKSISSLLDANEKVNISHINNLPSEKKNTSELDSKKHTTNEILQKLSTLSHDNKADIKERSSNENKNNSENSFEKIVLEALKSEIEGSNIHSDIFENITPKQKECSPQGKKIHIENYDAKKVRRISFEKYKEKKNSPLYEKIISESKFKKNDFDTIYNNQVEILNRVLTPKEIERFDSVIERTVVDTIVDSEDVSFENRVSVLQSNEDSSEILGPESPDSDSSFQYSQYDSPISEIHKGSEAINSDKMTGNIRFENEISSPNDFTNDNFNILPFEDFQSSSVFNIDNNKEIVDSTLATKVKADLKIFNQKGQMRKLPLLTDRFNVNFPVSANYRGKNPKPILGFTFKQFKNQKINEMLSKKERNTSSPESTKSISKPCVEKSRLDRQKNIGPSSIVVDEKSRHNDLNKLTSDSQKNVKKYDEYSNQIRRNSNVGRPKSESSKELNLHKSFRVSKETYSSAQQNNSFVNSDHKFTKRPLLPTPPESVSTNINHLWSVNKNDPRRHTDQLNRNNMNQFISDSDRISSLHRNTSDTNNMSSNNIVNVLKDPRLKRMDNQYENAENIFKNDIYQQKINLNDPATYGQKDMGNPVDNVDIGSCSKTSALPNENNTVGEKIDNCIEVFNSKHDCEVSKQDIYCIKDTKSNEINNSDKMIKIDTESEKNVIIIDESNNFVIYDEINSSSQKNMDKSKLYTNENECKVNESDSKNRGKLSQDQKFDSSCGVKTDIQLCTNTTEIVIDIKDEQITTNKQLNLKNSASDENICNIDANDLIVFNANKTLYNSSSLSTNVNETNNVIPMVTKPDNSSTKTDNLEREGKINSCSYKNDVNKVTNLKNNDSDTNMSIEKGIKSASDKNKHIAENNQKLNSNERKQSNSGGDEDLVSSLVNVLKNKEKMQEMLLLLSKKDEDLPPKIKKKLELLVNFESDDEIEENNSDTSETLHSESSGLNLSANTEVVSKSYKCADTEVNKEDDKTTEMKSKNRGKFRNEVELLREGLPEIFINQGALNPTGIRMCRLAREFNNESNVGKRKTRQAEKSLVKTKTSPSLQKKVLNTKKHNGNNIDEKLLSISVQKLDFLNTIKPIGTQENNEVEMYKSIRPCPKSKKHLMLSKKERSISSNTKIVTVKNNEEILTVNSGSTLFCKNEDIDKSKSNINILTNENILSEKKTNQSKKVRRKRKRGNKWCLGTIIKKYKRVDLKKKLSPIKIIDKTSFKTLSENEYLQLVNLKSYHFSSHIFNYECKYCDYNDEFIVKHYVENHPHSEILISRLSESEAIASIAEAKSSCDSLSNSCNYQCRFCQKIFMQSSVDVFYKHVMYFHTGEYENICKICVDKNNMYTVCKNKYAIERIGENVSILKGYVCEKCNYTQILKENLDIHIKLRHPNIKCGVFEVNLCAEVSSVNDNDVQELNTYRSVVSEPVVKNSKIKENDIDTILSQNIEINNSIIEKKQLPAQNNLFPDQINENTYECNNTSGVFSLSEVVSNYPTVLNSIDIRNVESLNNFNIKEEIIENIQDIDVDEEILNSINIKCEVDETISNNTVELTSINLNSHYSSKSYFSNDECRSMLIGNIYIEKFSNGTINYFCKIQNCSFMTKYDNVLRNHIEMIHASSLWDLFCKYCDDGVEKIYTTQVPHVFVVDHIIKNHISDKQNNALNLNTMGVELINPPSKVSNSPKIIVRPLSDLLPKENGDNVILKTFQEKDDCLPRIASVVSLNPDNDINCGTRSLLKIDLINNKMAPSDKIQESENEAFQECSDLFICSDKACSYSVNNEMIFRNHCISHKVFFNSNPINGFSWRTCVYCKMKFQDDSKIWKHIIDEHGHCQYKCTSCIFRSTSYILVYMHSIKLHPFVDNHRRVSLVEQHVLSSNKKNTHGMLSKYDCFLPYICTVMSEVAGSNNLSQNICEKRFYMPALFLNHIEEKHKVCKLFCAYCDKSEMTPAALTFHLRNEHNFYLFKCAYCKNGADTQISMLHHLLRCHQFRKPIFYVLSQTNNQNARIIKVDVDENIDYYMKNIFGETVSIRIPQKNIIEATVIQSIKEKDDLIPSLVGDNDNNRTEKNSNTSDTALLHSDNNLIETNDLKTNSTLCPPDVIIVDSDDDLSLVSQGNISNKSEELKNKIPIKQITVNKGPIIDESSKKIKNISRETNKVIGLVGKDLFKCGNVNCVYSCDTLSIFANHISSCNLGKKNNSCYHCIATFQNAKDFLLHIPIHGVFRYSCGLCDFKSALNIQCITHLRHKHGVFSTKRVYSETENLHTIIPADSDNEKGIKAKPTNNDASQQKRMKNTRDQTNENVNNKHMEKKIKQTKFGPKDVNDLPHIPILADNIFCTECSFSTKVTSNMSRHLQLHISDTIVPVAAPINPVPHLQSNEMHFDKMTNLALSSNIDKQSKIVVSRPADDETLVSLFVPAKERFVCGSQNCTYISVNELMLKQHWETLHREESSFFCVHCNKTIEFNPGNPKITKSIILHFKIHEEEFYQCKNCLFIGSLDVVRHHIIEIHNSSTSKKDIVRSNGTEFYWQCALCPKNALTKEDISSHCREKHNISDPYKCSKCNFTFKFLESINEHYGKKHKGISSKSKIVVFFKKSYSKRLEPILNKSSDTSKRKRVSTDEESIVSIRMNDKSCFKKIKIDNYDDVTEINNKNEFNIKDSEKNHSQNHWCPFCKKFSSHIPHLMRVHLFEELNYRKWSCAICGYKSFDSERITTHSLMEHHSSCLVKELTPDAKIESWVEDFLNNKITLESPLLITKLLSSESMPAVESKNSFIESEKNINSENSSDENRLIICDTTKSKMTHIKTHSEIRTLSCKLCNFLGLHDKSMKLHYSKQHKNPCKCRYCDFISDDELNLLKHHDENHIDLVFEIIPIISNSSKSRMPRQDYVMCFECRKLIKVSEVKSHKSNCYPVSILVKPIDNSAVKFSNGVQPSSSIKDKCIDIKCNSSELEQILICHEDISNKDISVGKEVIEVKTSACELCNFIGTAGTSMSLHNTKCHYKPCECKYCDYVTNNELQLLQHHNINHPTLSFKIIHTNKNLNAKPFYKKTHVCLQCKTPLEVSEIQYHELKCHPGTKDKLILHREAIVFQCSLCLNLFHDKTSLTVHFKNNHPSFEINYVMQRLGKSSKTFKKSNVAKAESDSDVNSDNKHKSQTRSLLKKNSDYHYFNCTYCSKKFKKFCGLTSHHNKLHENQILILDPLSCAQIQNTGEIKKNFNLKDGAYECILQSCKEMFTSFLTFREHVNAHYAFKCMQCPERFYCDELYVDHCKFEHPGNEFCERSMDRRQIKTDRINQIEKLLQLIYEKHLNVSTQSRHESNQEIDYNETLRKKPRLESKQVARKSTTQIGYGFYKQK